MGRGRVVDWIAIAAGVLMPLSWFWHNMLGPGMALMLVAGVLIVLAAAMAITRPGLLASEASVFGLGALVFVAPWWLSFDNAAAAVTAWVLGTVAMAAGVVGALQINAQRGHVGGGGLAAH